MTSISRPWLWGFLGLGLCQQVKCPDRLQGQVGQPKVAECHDKADDRRAGCSEGAVKPGWLTGELSAVLGCPGPCHEVGWYLMLTLKAKDVRSRRCLSSLGGEAAHEWQS